MRLNPQFTPLSMFASAENMPLLIGNTDGL
jgi:hypothetical protein